jgi:uncharacterized protein YbaR (Trm112 family)
MTDDPRRCPECDFELWYVHARHLRVEARIGPNAGSAMLLNTTDAIVCSRCGWWRPAEATDLPTLVGWPRQV